MELERKHLAPYLPYGLKWKMEGFPGFEQQYFNTRVDYSTKKMKPILRPLSDLTKEIEHNGEKFVPAESVVSFYKGCRSGSDFKIVMDQFTKRLKEQILSYDQVQKLFEWHFDVFGLIESGLAIDINTIK
jgi:hypothetical protein